MKDDLVDNEFELNSKDKLSKPQAHWLLYWWFRESILFFLAGFSLITYVSYLAVMILGVVLLICAVVYSRNYGMDLWRHNLSFLSGMVIKKEHIHLRGPVRYYIILDAHTKIRVSKSQYLEIEEGNYYELFTTKYTKWLLSYRSFEKP